MYTALLLSAMIEYKLTGYLDCVPFLSLARTEGKIEGDSSLILLALCFLVLFVFVLFVFVLFVAFVSWMVRGVKASFLRFLSILQRRQ
jgi:hypothetical protein